RDLLGFGQSCLAARRLIERGVPVVQVTLGGWDMHGNAFPALMKQCAVLDSAWDALLTDLKKRGLLETTLIVWMGEFGRTPRINQGAGRDHWSLAFSGVLAGGGIKGGQVIGKTDNRGANVEERPVSASELVATIYQIMGVDRSKRYKSNLDTMVPLVDEKAQPIKEILPEKKSQAPPAPEEIKKLIGQLSSNDFA